MRARSWQISGLPGSRLRSWVNMASAPAYWPSSMRRVASAMRSPASPDLAEAAAGLAARVGATDGPPPVSIMVVISLASAFSGSNRSTTVYMALA